MSKAMKEGSKRWTAKRKSTLVLNIKMKSIGFIIPIIIGITFSGAASSDEKISFPVEAIDRGSMSMRTVLIGAP